MWSFAEANSPQLGCKYVAAESDGARKYTRVSYFPREQRVMEPFDRNAFGQLVQTRRKIQRPSGGRTSFFLFLVLICSVVNKNIFLVVVVARGSFE